MVYLETWDEFVQASRNLFTQRPTESRFLLKYRAEDKALVLKTTDDVVTLKWKTTQHGDLKKVNVFVENLQGWMSGAQDWEDGLKKAKKEIRED